MKGIKGKEEPLKKTIIFDATDPQERSTYMIVDKFRYYQSKFIIKLISDFFATCEITEDTPYDDVHSLVKLYLSGKIQPFGKTANGIAFNYSELCKDESAKQNGDMTGLFATLLTQMNMQMQQMYQMQMQQSQTTTMQQSSMPIHTNPPEQTTHVKEQYDEKTHNIFIENVDESESDAKTYIDKSIHFDEEEDDEEDIAKLKAASAAFHRMV